MAQNGQLAPNFSLADAEDNLHQLSDYSGKRLVIFLRHLG